MLRYGHLLTRKGRGHVKSFLLSAALGLGALALVNLCGPYTGVFLPVNRLSLLGAGLLGIPGVTLLVLCKGFLL